MRWIGLNDGYVSSDGRFLVAQVTVHGRRGLSTRWALYGLVRVRSVDALAVGWQWTDRPIFGPAPTKRACQEHASKIDYQPQLHVEGHPSQLELKEQPEFDQDEPAPTRPAKRIAYGVCQECGCDYKRPAAWVYQDYCGPNCFSIVVERVRDIQQHLDRRVA
jgi:hypothetical protein